MGAPNTGKSSTLKALYTKLFPLDEYTGRLVRSTVSEHVFHSVFREAEEALSNSAKLIVKFLSKQEIDEDEPYRNGVGCNVFDD